MITAAVLVYVFVAATSPHHASAADATCSKGDTPCWCKSIGGTWRALQAPLLPACKVTYQHQGAFPYVCALNRQHLKHTVSPCQQSPDGVHIALLSSGAQHIPTTIEHGSCLLLAQFATATVVTRKAAPPTRLATDAKCAGAQQQHLSAIMAWPAITQAPTQPQRIIPCAYIQYLTQLAPLSLVLSCCPNCCGQMQIAACKHTQQSTDTFVTQCRH